MSREQDLEALGQFAFVDCETGGLGPGRMPWEVAVVRWNNRIGMWGTWVIQVTDWEDFDTQGMSDEAAAINGYHDRFLKDDLGITIPARAAAGLLANILRDSTLVGSAVYNDDAWLKNLMAAGGRTPTWSYRQRDVPGALSARFVIMDSGGLAWAREVATTTDQWQWRGDATGERYAAHTALGDTLACRDIWLHIYGLEDLA